MLKSQSRKFFFLKSSETYPKMYPQNRNKKMFVDDISQFFNWEAQVFFSLETYFIFNFKHFMKIVFQEIKKM